jgi:hypothetical protein
MQVKVITSDNVYRFNQKGQPIEAISEPYVRVDAAAREDLEALYDPLHDHISTAFTYDGNRITGLSADHVNAIQNFLLVEGAWYLNDLEDPSTDVAANGAPESKAECPGNGACASPAPAATPDPALAADKAQFSGFVPDDAQRTLLKELQETAEKLRRITPDSADKWNNQLQRQLNAVLYFGTDDVANACAEAKAKIEKLKQDAKTSGVPESVIEINMTPVEIPDGDNGPGEEEEF